MARPKKIVNKVLLADKMRKAVLQAAIEGKLTEQNPTEDGYASDLLADIESEKKQLIKAGAVKRQKSLPEIVEEEKQFDIPDNWEWVRLGELISVSSGQGLTKAQMIEKAEYPVYGGNGINGYFNDFLVEEGTLTIGRVGFYCGATHKTISKSWVTDNALIVSKFSDNIDTDFLHYFLNHLDLKKSSVATAQPVISGQRISQLLLPLPPALEQIRIVTKLKEVLAQIGSLQNDENELHRLQLAFPNQMQASLLQAAIEGKLTQQDAPKDGHASDLLANIEIEKKKLVEAGEIKLQKTLPPIAEEEKPFDIPDNWEWVRLDQLSIYIQRGRSPKYSSIEEIPVISQKCVQWNGFSLELAKFIDPGTKEKYQQERFLQEGDLLWNSTGLGTVGRITKYQEERNKYDIAVADSHVTVVRLLKKYVLSEYVELFISSPVIQHNIEDICSGSTKQKELATSTVKNTVLPLPPLAEQLRIVELLEQALPEIQTLKEI